MPDSAVRAAGAGGCAGDREHLRPPDVPVSAGSGGGAATGGAFGGGAAERETADRVRLFAGQGAGNREDPDGCGADGDAAWGGCADERVLRAVRRVCRQARTTT